MGKCKKIAYVKLREVYFTRAAWSCEVLFLYALYNEKQLQNFTQLQANFTRVKFA